MKTIVVKIDPPDVELEDVEDFLATDDLFVEYFNVFLALPTFPVPLCFNKDTGGFEVVSSAKKDLAQQIKTAMRSQKRTPRIYKVAKKHSFIDIPLFPIDNVAEADNVEINTSFAVMTLNKEQGIHWIKAERLPAFLESDLYIEYRLSKLLSQARITGEHGEYVLMKIDFKPRVKKVKKKEPEEEVKIDPKEAMMKDMFVCMGNAGTTATDAWYSTAKIAQETESTYSALSRPQSETIHPKTGGRPVSARPASAYTDPYHRSDSGMGSSMKSSVRGNSYNSVYQSKQSTIETDDDILVSKLFSSDGRPGSHKITESVCVINKEHSKRTRPFSATVYSTPKAVNISADPDASIIDENENDDERDSGKGDDDVKSDLNDSINSDTDSGKGLVFKNIDEIGSVIAGVILKSALSQLIGKDNIDIEDVPEIKKIFPDKSFANLTVDSLGKICLQEESEQVETKNNEKVEMVGERMKKVLDEESDVDSLLDSEEDYEERDTFFRKHKFKLYNMGFRKGIEQFKRFLKGTQGEKNWNLWIDIDRMKLMTNEEEIQLYLNGLREKYHKPGAEFELTTELKNHLELVEPSSWTLDKMFDIQNDIVEPLVLYWAPRFLLKQLMRAEPDKNFLYQHQKLLSSYNGIDPNPPTANLLPLRPKSCHPRLKIGAIEPIRQEPEIQPSPYHLFTEQPPQLETSPPVGLKRSYTQPTLEFIAQWQKDQNIHTPHTPVASPRTGASPRLRLERTSTPRIKSAPPIKSSPVHALARPKSSKSLRPSSGKSDSSRMSVESATGRYRIKSASARAKSPQISLKLPRDSGRNSPRHNMERLSRPGSAASSIGSVSSLRSEAEESETSEFLGGRRMESLLQALHFEPDSGGFFRRYIEKSENQTLINNLNFWRDVQQYHLLFYSKSLDAYVVNKKAKGIHSQYIVVGAFHPIHCSPEIAADIYCHLDPPFEELFDEAEEHAIEVLYEAWQLMLDTDQKTYNKVELIEVKRHLETKSKYVLHLKKRGLIKQVRLTSDKFYCSVDSNTVLAYKGLVRPVLEYGSSVWDPQSILLQDELEKVQKRAARFRASTPDMMEGYQDPVYDEALLQNIPEQFKDYTLEKLVHNRIELEHFRNFLADNYASMDIMCWMDIEAFRRITHTDERKRDLKAKEIKTKYLNKKYFFGPNSPAGKEGQEKVVEAGGGWGKLLEDRPPNPMILEAQKYVQERLEKKWLPLFLTTPDFAIRQKPRTSMDEVVDDVLVQKRKKSQAVWKLLESKWVSSSKEIITFRKALLNPVTSLQFRRYVSIKGDKQENNVLFWLEVQKFKNMYHAHNEDSLINQKINTIINCFIESQIPPTLQIDVPQEVADKILDHKYEKSPYLFREAQLIIFRVLFGHWNDFCEFRSNLADDKVMPTIERRRKHAKIKERQKQKEEEEKQARARLRLQRQREAERRAALGLPPLGEDEDVFHDPFKSHGADSVEGEHEVEEKDKISWSYSNYMAALEKEELLNNTDETSFSSLLTANTAGSEKDVGSDKESVGSKHSEAGDKKIKADNGSQTTERRKSVKISNGKKGDDSDVPKKKVKETGSRKSSVDVTERRESVSKLSGEISQKTASPDTTASLKTKENQVKSNGKHKN